MYKSDRTAAGQDVDNEHVCWTMELDKLSIIFSDAFYKKKGESTMWRTVKPLGLLVVGLLSTGAAGFGVAEAFIHYSTISTQGFQRNANGKTYGKMLIMPFGQVNSSKIPNLVEAVATNGKAGYVYESELMGHMPKNPQQAVAIDNQGPRTIPVYAKNGTTKIGEFVIGGHAQQVNQ